MTAFFAGKLISPQTLEKIGSFRKKMDEKGSFRVDLTFLVIGSAILGFIGFRSANRKPDGGGITMVTGLQVVIVAVSWTNGIPGERLLTGLSFSIFWLVIPVDGGRIWMGFYFTVGDYSSASGGGGVDGLPVVFRCSFGVFGLLFLFLVIVLCLLASDVCGARRS